jgi:GNAT superfamily N-acetyltransferase
MPTTVTEVSPDRFQQLNAMCVPPGKDAPDVLAAMSESADAMRKAFAEGLRVFGAFIDSRPVGRLEISPVEAAPVPLRGRNARVIRCIWVIEKAAGLGLGRRLLELALGSVEAQTVAVLTYPDWMPPAFFEKFGFRQVQRHGEATVLVRSMQRVDESARNDPAELNGSPAAPETAGISYVPVKPELQVSPDFVRVDAVYTPRCPWRIVNVRQRLATARDLSDRVMTYEHRLNSREDALRLGEEYTYVDGQPLYGGPVSKEVFLHAVMKRLRDKGLFHATMT